MALVWDWSEKCGEAIWVERRGDKDVEFTLSLYEGNAFLIILNEYTDKETGKEMYNLFSFFLDEQHMKNCLGLGKGADKSNMFCEDGQRMKAFRINKSRCRNINKIVPLLVKAFDNIDISIYSEE